VSVIILLEPHWGYYIHGESIHAHSDVSHEEFQRNLELETRGTLPARGLGGQSECQTFEVFIGMYTRSVLWMCQQELMQITQSPQTFDQNGAPVDMRHHRRFLQFLSCQPGVGRVHRPEVLEIKRKLNEAFMRSVRGAEKALMRKFFTHAIFDIPPDLLFINGPFAGEEKGIDFFFLDDVLNFGGAFLYGLDVDLVVFYVLFYIAIDLTLQNSFGSMIVTYVLERLILAFRQEEGEANLGTKTLIDDRFFL
jgi:meckelin